MHFLKPFWKLSHSVTCWLKFPTKQGALLNLRPAFESCTHPSTNVQTQVNRPAVSWSQIIFFQSFRLGEGARSPWQHSDLPAWGEKLSGFSVAAQILSTDFTPWELSKSCTIYQAPSLHVLSKDRTWEDAGQREGVFLLHPLKSSQSVCFQCFRTTNLFTWFFTLV